MTKNRILLDGAGFDACLERIANEIARRNPDGERLMIVGIQAGGVRLAERIAARLGQSWGRLVPQGVLDISMHRDDVGDRSTPVMRSTELPGDVAGRTVVLTDDVIQSGRTTRSALDALNDFGRPRRIQLAVMVDRGNRELPIMPDYVGVSVQTDPNEHVEVRYAEDGGRDEIVATTAAS